MYRSQLSLALGGLFGNNRLKYRSYLHFHCGRGQIISNSGKMSIHIQDFILTDLFMETMLQWNEGGTRNLTLRGNDLSKKVGRRIQDGDMLRIVNFLAKHPEIISLELPYNEIKNCGVYNLMKYIEKNPTIKYLNLVGNEIGADGIRHIAALGRDLPFYVLRLSGNKIGDEGGKLLSQLLYLDIPLKILDVSDCHQTMSGLAYILSGLMESRGGAGKIEIIDIGRPLQPFYHRMCSAHAAEFFGQVFRFNTSLKEFHAQQYQLDFRDAEIFMDGLMKNRNLKLLDINNNNIGDDGVEYLCAYLRTGPPLSGLMIAANNFGDKGARCLSFNLPYSNIELLDISNNRVTDSGILDILRSIKKAVEIKKLFIWGNQMTHKCLVLVNLFLTEGILHEDGLDIKLYCTDEGFKAGLNSSANMYTHRFYCVSNYGYPPIQKVIKNQRCPDTNISFRHHMCDTDTIFGP